MWLVRSKHAKEVQAAARLLGPAGSPKYWLVSSLASRSMYDGTPLSLPVLVYEAKLQLLITKGHVQLMNMLGCSL